MDHNERDQTVVLGPDNSVEEKALSSSLPLLRILEAKDKKQISVIHSFPQHKFI